MVIFGASGDLTKRKLIPALYNLAKDHLLSPQFFAVIGFSFDSLTTESFRAQLTEDMKEFAPEPVDSHLFGTGFSSECTTCKAISRTLPRTKN